MPTEISRYLTGSKNISGARISQPDSFEISFDFAKRATNICCDLSIAKLKAAPMANEAAIGSESVTNAMHSVKKAPNQVVVRATRPKKAASKGAVVLDAEDDFAPKREEETELKVAAPNEGCGGEGKETFFMATKRVVVQLIRSLLVCVHFLCNPQFAQFANYVIPSAAEESCRSLMLKIPQLRSE